MGDFAEGIPAEFFIRVPISPFQGRKRISVFSQTTHLLHCESVKLRRTSGEINQEPSAPRQNPRRLRGIEDYG